MATSHPKVIAAMSGGVDSSVAAALLRDAGHEVTGITMRLLPQRGSQAESKAIEDARRVAAHLGIPHHVADVAAPFQEHVLGYFVSEYSLGRTPNPCIRCNQRIKFGVLFDEARRLGGQFLATGHYARIACHEGRYAISRARFREKDQSYVLAGLSQEQLRHAMFPLGEKTKDQTRAIARSMGLDIAETPESQDICFIEDGDYRRFLAEQGLFGLPGPIVSATGETLGAHTGLTNYTIGQRKGLGIAAPRPYYVLRLDTERNALVVGHHEETFAKTLAARDVVWTGIPPQTAPLECSIQIRYRHKAAPCTVDPAPDHFSATFHEPERAVTPGQWAVLYRRDLVLAAGIIDMAE
ncbi:MAG TPA: tRNA 2-thiouridine(34) synthase MnmA [Candidatus Hydrogenedentes bacterium]|nr:tRNA 2-thiouridine(34) synthase MnmA [Candidatus Hydrogenedentota bacterium]